MHDGLINFEPLQLSSRAKAFHLSGAQYFELQSPKQTLPGMRHRGAHDWLQ